MTREEWTAAYAEHIAKALDIELAQASDLAETGAASEEEDEGPNVSEWRKPQDAADDELSYWGD